jgi:hypothetical protein
MPFRSPQVVFQLLPRTQVSPETAHNADRAQSMLAGKKNLFRGSRTDCLILMKRDLAGGHGLGYEERMNLAGTYRQTGLTGLTLVPAPVRSRDEPAVARDGYSPKLETYRAASDGYYAI